MSDHVADQAGFLAALSEDDSERRQAEAHARSCGPCREALDEGARLALLLRKALLPRPRRELVSVQPSQPASAPTAVAVARRLAWTTTGAVVLAWLFQITVGGGFRLDRDCVLVSLGVLAVAIACGTVLGEHGRFAVATVVVTSGLFAYLAGSAAGFAPGIGIRCTFRELWAAALTWVVVLVVGRRAGVTLDRSRMMAVAAGGALAAHAGQHLACAVPHADGHLLVFHFGGVLVAIALGAWLSSRATAW